MDIEERLIWFKSNFGAEIAAATRGTPISVDLVCAIALQETGYLWPALISHHNGDVAAVLEGCVGDTLDAPRRSAFPKNKADLLQKDYGQDMFDIGRTALENLAVVSSGYRGAASNPDKFCRGYGILQYDLQHIRSDEEFFLNRQWLDFSVCLEKCLHELDYGLRVRGFERRTSLTNFEAATVAIVYNTGRYRESRALKQGYKVGDLYYGELIFKYIEIAQRIEPKSFDDIEDTIPNDYRVTARSGLRLRGGPGQTFDVIDVLPLDAVVNVITFMGPGAVWALVDLENDGNYNGFMFGGYLERVDDHNGSDVEEGMRVAMLSESGLYAQSAPSADDEFPD